MQLEHRMSALLQLHLYSQNNPWFLWNGLRQLQNKMRITLVLGLGVAYIRNFTVLIPHAGMKVIKSIHVSKRGH